MIVQIYEVQTPSEAETLVELGVDHIGSVILSEENWKVPSVRDTVRVMDKTAARSSLIFLFNRLERILEALDYYRPDIVHFCDVIPSQGKKRDTLFFLQKNVKKEFPDIKIMRSVPIPRAGFAQFFDSMDTARMFEPVSDCFLTDTLFIDKAEVCLDQQPVQSFVGLTGFTCDWDVASELVKSSRIPVILAGGISPENVSDGIRRVLPAGVDSCTGTNAVDSAGRTIRFKKDLDKVKRLVEAVRVMEKELGEVGA